MTASVLKRAAAQPKDVARASSLDQSDMNDLCDAMDLAIEAGGGFGWTELPSREILERYWQGVIAMPQRRLFLARLDQTVCGAAQLVLPTRNNEAQAHAAHITGMFAAPWARGHGLARGLVEAIEKEAMTEGFSILNLDVQETQSSAIRIYRALGYIQWGTHPAYAEIEGRRVRGLFFYKELGPASENQS